MTLFERVNEPFATRAFHLFNEKPLVYIFLIEITTFDHDVGTFFNFIFGLKFPLIELHYHALP